MWDRASGIVSLLSMVLLLCLVLAMAYYATRLIGKRYAPSNSNNMRIIDRMMLGPDRAVFIVEVAGQTMLLGVTPHHIERLCELDSDKIEIATPGDTDFAKTLRELLNQKLKGREEGTHKDASQ